MSAYVYKVSHQITCIERLIVYEQVKLSTCVKRRESTREKPILP